MYTQKALGVPDVHDIPVSWTSFSLENISARKMNIELFVPQERNVKISVSYTLCIFKHFHQIFTAEGVQLEIPDGEVSIGLAEEEQKSEKIEELEKLIALDPLTNFSASDKELIWQNRYLLKPFALGKLADSVHWPWQVTNFYQILDKWPKVSTAVALEVQNEHE